MTIQLEEKAVLEVIAEIEMLKDLTLTRYRNSITREAYIKDIDAATRLLDKLLGKGNIE